MHFLVASFCRMFFFMRWVLFSGGVDWLLSFVWVGRFVLEFVRWIAMSCFFIFGDVACRMWFQFCLACSVFRHLFFFRQAPSAFDASFMTVTLCPQHRGFCDFCFLKIGCCCISCLVIRFRFVFFWMLWFLVVRLFFSGTALRIHPAVTRLTVYRRPYVSEWCDAFSFVRAFREIRESITDLYLRCTFCDFSGPKMVRSTLLCPGV